MIVPLLKNTVSIKVEIFVNYPVRCQCGSHLKYFKMQKLPSYERTAGQLENTPFSIDMQGKYDIWWAIFTNLLQYHNLRIGYLNHTCGFAQEQEKGCTINGQANHC